MKEKSCFKLTLPAARFICLKNNVIATLSSASRRVWSLLLCPCIPRRAASLLSFHRTELAIVSRRRVFIVSFKSVFQKKRARLRGEQNEGPGRRDTRTQSYGFISASLLCLSAPCAAYTHTNHPVSAEAEVKPGADFSGMSSTLVLLHALASFTEIYTGQDNN